MERSPFPGWPSQFGMKLELSQAWLDSKQSASRPPPLKHFSHWSLEELMLKLKPQYASHLTRRANSLEKTLMLGKIEGRRRRGQQRMSRMHHRLNGCEFEQALGDGDGQGGLACCSPWGRKESDTTEQLNNVRLWPVSQGVLRLAGWADT